MSLDRRGTLIRSRAFNVRRREPRYVCSVPVTLQRFLRFGPVFTRGVSLDISVRGMSALVCGAPRVGETVVIELPLRDVPIETLAMVRHSSDAKSGFEFYPLSPIAEEKIQEWIHELKEHEESLFPYPHVSAAKIGSG
ncbi:MAG: PilZ domain-containing protein [Terriglobales bacterium]